MTIEIPESELKVIQSALLYKVRGLSATLSTELSQKQRDAIFNEQEKARRVLAQLTQLIH